VLLAGVSRCRVSVIAWVGCWVVFAAGQLTGRGSWASRVNARARSTVQGMTRPAARRRPRDTARNAGGGVQQPVAQLFRFRYGMVAVEDQELGSGELVAGGQGKFGPGGVDRELAGREPAEAGVFAAADAVLDAGVAAVADRPPPRERR
jgi:hypothetical protein